MLIYLFIMLFTGQRRRDIGTEISGRGYAHRLFKISNRLVNFYHVTKKNISQGGSPHF